MTEQQAYPIVSKTAEYLVKNYQIFSGIKPAELTHVGFAIAKLESRLNPNAKNSTSTAKGIMQILDGTKKEVETKILKIPEAPMSRMFDANYNILLGMAYLAYQYTRYGMWDKAIIAFNRGHYEDSYNDSAYYLAFLSIYTNTKYLKYEKSENNIVDKIFNFLDFTEPVWS